MNILIGNWAWRRVAGEWTYIENLLRLYTNRGHHVIPFSMKHPGNQDAAQYEPYFIEHIDYIALSRRKNLSNSIRAVSTSVYSKEAKTKIERLLSDHPVDVAHLHDVNHYLTPAILPVLKKRGIPIFWTLHDYTLICPEGTFNSRGRICENCKGGLFYHCVLQKCKKASLLPSVLAAVENTVHTYSRVFRHVDYFLCPSEFLYNKFKEFNFYPEKLVLSNLCCEIEPQPVYQQPEPYIIYTGRLAKVKGLFTLLRAIKEVPVKLLIAGDGPEAAAVKDFIAANGLARVGMLGFQPKEALHRLVQEAVCLVCPSEWYENFPYAIIEAMLLKTPVIAAAIGGIPELVIHEQTGLLFGSGNWTALRDQLLRLLADKELQQTLAGKAYTRTRSIVDDKQHVKRLLPVYERAGLVL